MEFNPQDHLAAGGGELAETDAGPSPPPPPASDTGADAGSEAPANPRKRKKASRAQVSLVISSQPRQRLLLTSISSCDFCHVNHQPCDNGKPKCSVCAKHNKPCLYLRPTKRRGPQKGYRTALNTYKESAAAWGAVLDAIPGLDALIEGHLRGNAGKSMIAAIKDSNQQEALINKWQQSSVFKAFFGHNGPTPSAAPENNVLPSREPEEEEMVEDVPGIRPPPAKRILQQPPQPPPPPPPRSQSASSFILPEQPRTPIQLAQLGSPFQPKDSASLSDIVARDAVQAYVALFLSESPLTMPSLTFHQRPENLPNPCLAWFRTGRDVSRLLQHWFEPGPSAGN